MESKRYKVIISMFIFVITLSILGLVFSVQEKYECDQVIFLEGELGMDCCNVSSYKNGMSIITLCDSTKMRVPTNRIVKIVDK